LDVRATGTAESSSMTFEMSDYFPIFNWTGFRTALASHLAVNDSQLKQLSSAQNITSNGTTVSVSALADAQDEADAILNHVVTSSRSGALRYRLPTIISVAVAGEVIFVPALPASSPSSGSSGLPTEFLGAIIAVSAVACFGVIFVCAKVIRDVTRKPTPFVLPPLPTFDTAAPATVSTITAAHSQEQVNAEYENWWHGRTEAKPRVYV